MVKINSSSKVFLLRTTRIYIFFFTYTDVWLVIDPPHPAIMWSVCLLSVSLRALQFPPEGWLRMGLNNGSITWLTIRPSGRVALRTLGDSGFMPVDKLTRTWCHTRSTGVGSEDLGWIHAVVYSSVLQMSFYFVLFCNLTTINAIQDASFVVFCESLPCHSLPTFSARESKQPVDLLAQLICAANIWFNKSVEKLLNVMYKSSSQKWLIFNFLKPKWCITHFYSFCYRELRRDAFCTVPSMWGSFKSLWYCAIKLLFCNCCLLCFTLADTGN